ncbi:MAG: hypothetical protein ACUVQP_12045 [Bacteroidales bacterium]
MNNNSILIVILIITFEAYSQNKLIENTSDVKKERVLRSYINAGVGRTSNYLNIGAGIFFPLDKNILIGPKANVNTELDAFPFKFPLENIWDINLTVKYVPFISERFIFLFGAGAGYSRATKRGNFIRYNLITAEYEKVHVSSVSVLGELEVSFLITDNLGINLTGYTLFADNRTFVRYQLGLFLCKIIELK